MKIEPPFKYIRSEEDHSIYLAKFPLAYDQTPNGEQYLLITVKVYDDSSEPIGITLDVLTCSGKVRRVVYADSGEIESIAEMLYGTARLVTRKTIEPYSA